VWYRSSKNAREDVAVSTQGSLPGFYERRELLFAAKPVPASLSAQGRIFLEAGLLDSALESFAMAGDSAGLAQVEAAARSAGDTFSLVAALKALGKTPTSAEWAAIGETALNAGMLWFAYRAFEKADNQDGLERTRTAMHAAGITPEQHLA
jgi:hypothetical protein